MRSHPSGRELVSELIAWAESDDCEQELNELLLVYGGQLGEVLGATGEELVKLAGALPDRRRARVRELIAHARERSQASRAEQLENLARAGADMLAGLARFRDVSVELDARIVLGNLLAGAAKYVCFEVEGYDPVAVPRIKLKQTARALKPFELHCFIDARGLTFTWRGGVGRLLLFRQPVPRHEQERVLTVVVKRPLPVPVNVARPSPHERPFRPATLFGDVLADFGFLV